MSKFGQRQQEKPWRAPFSILNFENEYLEFLNVKQMCNDGGYLYGEVYVAKCARKGNMNCMT
jgi:hypothetical protein